MIAPIFQSTPGLGPIDAGALPVVAGAGWILIWTAYYFLAGRLARCGHSRGYRGDAAGRRNQARVNRRLDRSTEESRYTIRAVTRAIDLLNTVADAPGPSDLSDLARQAGLPISTTLRYLESYASAGVHRANRQRQVHARRTAVPAGVDLHLRDVALWEHSFEIARDLADRAKETVSVGILDEGHVLYIAIVNAQRESSASNGGRARVIRRTAPRSARRSSLRCHGTPSSRSSTTTRWNG